MDGIGEQIFIIANWVLLSALLLLLIPFRRTSRIRISRVLKTTQDAAWHLLLEAHEFRPGDGRPKNPVMHDSVTAAYKVSDDPLIYEYAVNASKSRASSPSKMQAQILVVEKPARMVSAIIAMNGVPYPLGPGAQTETLLETVPGGTRITQIHHLRTRNLLHHLWLRATLGRVLVRAQRYYATGSALDPSAARRGAIIRLALSVLAFGSFALAFGWAFGIGLGLVILLHELGHWWAMRLRGYAGARLTLVPFLGGIAMPGEPYRTAFDAAICALAGPGVSALICGVALAASHMLALPILPNRIAFEPTSTGFDWRSLLDEALALTGFVNLLQLVPILPLDGGHLWRLLLQRSGTDWARWTGLLLGGIACGLAIWAQQYLLVPIALIGIAMLAQTSPGAAAMAAQMPAMTAAQRLGILAATAAALAVLTLACAPILGTLLGYPDLQTAAAFISGARQPVAGAAGSKTVPSVYAVVSPVIAGLDQHSFVTGGDGKSRRIESLTWGYSNDDGPYMRVWFEDMSQLHNTVRSIAELTAYAEGLSDKDADPPQALDAASQPFVIGWNRGKVLALRFNGMFDGIEKSCLAFHGFAKAGDVYLQGHACAAVNQQVHSSDVACLLDGLRLDADAASRPASLEDCQASTTPAASQ